MSPASYCRHELLKRTRSCLQHATNLYSRAPACSALFAVTLSLLSVATAQWIKQNSDKQLLRKHTTPTAESWYLRRVHSRCSQRHSCLQACPIVHDPRVWLNGTFAVVVPQLVCSMAPALLLPMHDTDLLFTSFDKESHDSGLSG